MPNAKKLRLRLESLCISENNEGLIFVYMNCRQWTANCVHLERRVHTHTHPCAAVCLHHTKNNIFLGSLWHHKTLFAQFYVYSVCLGQLLTFSALSCGETYLPRVFGFHVFLLIAQLRVLSFPHPTRFQPPSIPPHHHHPNLKLDTSMFSPALFYFPLGGISIYIKNNIGVWHTGEP